MSRLPEQFSRRMQEQLGAEYEDFLACFDQEEYAGLRVNTGKISVEHFLSITPFHLEPVPWTDNGFYYRKEEPVTKHPHYFAGLYYIQEPSAMLPASRLPVCSGETVLDLCAAPGGKATELSSRLGRDGLLIANDVSTSRAKALVKNLTVWGTSNCCITGETPQKLLDTFGCSFDKILVDAPCSGEGMFRKDPGLIDSWRERGPQSYAPLQKEILTCAAAMLKPGGMMVYSTCTFSEEEDESVIEAILERRPDLSLVQPPVAEGFAQGRHPLEACIRVWPHRVHGEGHFLALMKKESSGQNSDPLRKTEQEIRDSWKKAPEEVRRFLSLIPEQIWKNSCFGQIGEQCYLLPPYRIPGKLRYLRTGVLLGTWKRGRFEPDQSLAMVLRAEDFPCVLNLSSEDPRVIRYLKGETLELTDTEARDQKGWMLVCVDGYSLGWGKAAGTGLKNKYYPGWRLQ